MDHWGWIVEDGLLRIDSWGMDRYGWIVGDG